MKSPASLTHLIQALKVLPGIGPKSAQRIAFHLLQRDQDGARALAQALNGALDSVLHCQRCNTFSETSICSLCSDASRLQHSLMIVEMPADLINLEEAKCYNGLYFVLMGRISPLEGIGPKEIALRNLMDRVQDNIVKEIIIATNFTAEGEATAHIISELLKDKGFLLSRIARGMPVGGELEYIDKGTLAQAVYERREL